MCTGTMRYYGHFFAAIGTGLLAGLTPGCASFTQTQYFEVVSPPNPETGIATKNYYKMTMTGRGDLLNKYNMNAAYVSKASIEMLRGETPTIPVVDIPEENLEKFEAIKGHLLTALETQAESQAEAASVHASVEAQEEHLLAITRQLWYASLSDSDLISMGEIENADPYEFRRLVFYTTAENIKYEQIATEVDSIISDVEAIARNAKARKEAEKAEREKRRQAILSNTDGIRTMANNLPDGPQKTAILNLVDLVDAFNTGSEGEE